MGKGWKSARAMLCITSGGDRGGDEIAAAALPSLQDLMTLDRPLQESGPRSASGRRSKSTGRRNMREGMCSICLDPMAPGAGHALFTAECSHMFHFSCIASNVRHGNRVCPVCRAKWIDLPWQQVKETPPELRSHHSQPFVSHGNYHVDPVLRILNESIQRERARYSRMISASRADNRSDPAVYDDDEECGSIHNVSVDPREILSQDFQHQAPPSRVPKIAAFTECGSVQADQSRNPFTVLVNLKASSSSSGGSATGSARAPIDLVTVLDVSGSMAGSKLALVKSAMEFVIGQLGPRDRLSVISFATNAARLFPLKRMDDTNKRRAVRAVHALVASGGTNIGDALKKAGKVLGDRRHRNAVSSVILLSDGQDTSAFFSSNLLRQSLSAVYRHMPPVHAFGVGSDHDAPTLHAIAEATSGTFSFVHAAAAVRDAFAQCIGGLLSVVSQGVEVWLHAAAAWVKILRVENGGFESWVSGDGSSALVTLGDLYAEEERDVLVQIELGACAEAESIEIFRIGCRYRDALEPGEVAEAGSTSISVRRPAIVQSSSQTASLEVDRQRNRLLVSETMASAGNLADAGNLEAAQDAISASRSRIERSFAFASGDALSKSLHSELGEVLHRMENRRIYEESGRAYTLSVHSSHLHQRATMRQGPNDDDLYGQSYVTSSMAEMVHLSQTFGASTAAAAAKTPPVTRIGRSRSSRKVNPAAS
ncbi:uncharacterized protein LOC112344835 [Selaginella moellendorffii]|uniref:uncharacterized protein LOC112344835 n=1 Tax=Selaginella moellendorffii TaxID=88036 RepID=UPI000D1C5698|nr:uncharacterized protein LOC112344835 [Selaginella moellendorffii]|eukprot:XP_024526057.1 uncharacterized protein LOC112344835 [Selaginella moellendorffii]